MPKSRTGKNKKKQNIPMWLVGAVIVVVVILAGYLIIRFSQAGGTDGKSGGGSGTEETVTFKVGEMNGYKGAYKTKIVHPNGGVVYGKEPIDVWALPKGAGVVGFGKELYPSKRISVNYCVNGFRLNGSKGNAKVTLAPAGNLKSSSFSANISKALNYCSGNTRTYLQIPAFKNAPINLRVENTSDNILYVIDTFLFY